MNIKTTKNSILFLAVATLLVSYNSTLAYVPGVWDPQPSRINANEPAFYKVPVTYDEPVVMQTSNTIASNLGINNTSNTSNTNTSNSTTTKKATNTTTTSATTKKTTNVNSTTSNSELKPVVIDNGNDLAALSLKGSGGFMPSSIWQWFLVILLILVIIILARILSRPAHHEVHGVTAH